MTKLFPKSQILYSCCDDLPFSIKPKGSHLQSFQTGRDNIRLSPTHQFQVRAAAFSILHLENKYPRHMGTVTLTPPLL